jgi:M6 family metalloprotease-like protein
MNHIEKSWRASCVSRGALPCFSTKRQSMELILSQKEGKRRQCPSFVFRLGRLVAFMLALGLSCPSAQAVPACPQPSLLDQPDGSSFFARKVGDENWNATETEDGYTIVQEDDSGFWFYAIEKDDVPAKSKFAVGEVSPKSLGLKKHLRPWKQPGEKKALLVEGKAAGDESVEPSSSLESLSAATSPPGVLTTTRGLVILARFFDHTVYTSQDEFNQLFNEVGYSSDGAVGSVRDYYLEVSAGQLTVDSTVSVWVTLPREESFYGANTPDGRDSSPAQLVRDAVQALNALGFSFRSFDADRDGEIDMLTVIHSGLGEEVVGNPSNCVWSQVISLVPAERVDGIAIRRAAIAPERRYNTTSITRIGVICHETGHLIGLPDLYDTDGSSSGIGVWGIMGAGSWGGNLASPERPVHFCSWSKATLGWIDPTEIDGSDSPVSIPGIEKAGTWGLYKVTSEMADGEYLLFENRRNTGFDLNLPGSGLLIWHIDENQPWDNTDETHYRVGLLQADGDSDLEEGINRGDAGDPYPGSSYQRELDDTTMPGTASYYNGTTYVAISDISDSAATMSFEISTLTDIFCEDFSEGLPAGWEIVDGGDDGYTWTDQNPGSRTDPNWSGGFMIVDSDFAGYRTMDEHLISPVIDCSQYVHVRLQFSHFFRASGAQTGDVAVRIDEGKWENVAHFQYGDDSGTKNIDISSLADGRSSVQIRWRFYNISYGWYWGIDNVALRGELPSNAPPRITITSVSQRRDGSGRLEVRFIGSDAENDPAMWEREDCQYSPSPYAEWQPLEFDLDDPSNTAIEPMPFTAKGIAFVATVDASTWNGLFEIRLRVTSGVTSEPAVTSDEFSVDTTAATVLASTFLESDLTSGMASATALASWEDANPGLTWFQLRLNDQSWSDPVEGTTVGEYETATFTPLLIDGDDEVVVKSYHIDEFGNPSEESVSPPHYVKPLTPSFPTFGESTGSSLTVIIHPNPLEAGDVDYAVFCSTTGQYADWLSGGLGNSPVWGSYYEWGAAAGAVVGGLELKTVYSFQVMAANPHDHDRQSSLSSTGTGATGNSPPYAPVSVQISPGELLTSDEAVCVVTPAIPADPDETDTVVYRFIWSCPEKADVIHGPKAELTDVLSSDHTSKGDIWTCTVQGYDSQEYGPAAAAEVLIVNSPPSLEITGQQEAYAGQAIELLIVSADADGDDVIVTCPGVPDEAVFLDGGDGEATFTWANSSMELRQEVGFISNDGEEETSASVTLTLTQQRFEILAVRIEEAEQPTLSITWYALPGVLYSVERSTDLLSWDVAGSGISLTEGSVEADWLSYQEEIESSSPLRFYRVRM